MVAENQRALGVIYLKDIVKGGMRERFNQLRAMGIKTVMITGDNPLTAAAIAREAGVDDFLAEATPKDKMDLIRREQADGKLVAMTGDGTNDAPALAQADVGVAMNTGTQAAKEAGNMVDLDSNPTKLIEVVAIGKQLLMTRGALTTFSIANDVAKYFAIIPAMFAGTFPVLNALNIMQLQTPQSAVLSAVIFNALIIVALIPLALRGVKYKAMSADALLRQNLLVYGFGGIVVPFIGIKLIDMFITGIRLVVGRDNEEKSDHRCTDDDRDDGPAGNSVSPAGDRTRATDLPQAGQRPADHGERWSGSWVAPHRAAIFGTGLFSFAAIRCGRCRLRCQRLRRLESRSDQRAVDRSRQRRRRQAAGRESRHSHPCRSGYDIGFGTRSGYLASGGASSRFDAWLRNARFRRLKSRAWFLQTLRTGNGDSWASHALTCSN